ncbi:MAG: hypothetical protein Q8Q18_02405 [bacterium]|nr:hypothetical protein [bacterium]
MHDHNNGGGYKGMMWMMIPCLLLLGILFLGGGKLSGGGYFWPIIGVFVVAHVWMMFRGHGKHGNVDAEVDDTSTKQHGAKDGHKHGDCCH